MIKNLIPKYLQQIESESENSELYKWNGIKHFQENWNNDCSDSEFYEMFKKSFAKRENLIFQNSFGFLISLANEYPNKAKELLNYLFQDGIPLETRLPKYQEMANSFLPELKQKLGKETLNHQQDERTISFLLTLHNPEKYYLYKDNVYRSLCTFLGVETKTKAGEKYFHFSDLADKLKLELFENEEIKKNQKIIQIRNDFPFNSDNLLFQDIIYRCLVVASENERKRELMSQIIADIQAELNNRNHILAQHTWLDNDATNFRQVSVFNDKSTYPLHYEIMLHSDIAWEFHVEGNRSQKEFFEPFIQSYDKEKYKLIPWKHAVSGNYKSGEFHKVSPKVRCKIETKGDKYENMIVQLSDQFIDLYNDTNTPLIDYLKLHRNELIEGVKIPTLEVMKQPLNQILYGPPGTGKTYSTIDIVNNIIEPENKFTRKEKKNLFDKLLNDKRVYFTTFHQSMSYEEFIEGIKPITVKDQVHYKITDGIFKSICEQCLDEIKEFKNQNAPKSEANLTFKEKFDEFVLAIQKGIIEIKTRSGIEVNLSKVSPAGNIRLITGTDTRDYIISANRLEKLFNAFPNPNVIVNIHDEIRNVIGGSHSSLYYAALEAFVKFDEEIQKSVHIEGKELELKDIKLTEEEIQSLPPYFLVIDEINRGNVSSIFGELITLLEEDKRFGKENQLFIKLPYSKEDFIVPPNLYIIGTMNTADRSVEALDTALRRRFSFVEMLPLPQLLTPLAVSSKFYQKSNHSSLEKKLFEFLGVKEDFKELVPGFSLIYNENDKKEYAKIEVEGFQGVNLSKLLTTINERIEVLVDRDHTIGHAYLMDVFDTDGLKFAFQNKIIPLLQEYFYGNYTKMEMVIGSYFFEEFKNKKVTFAIVNHDYDDLPKQYKLKNILSEEFNMMDAIDSLYNEKKDSSQLDAE